MSLPGKTMKIGGYNYHVSDQGEGDKVAMLVHGMPDDGSCWKYQAPALLKAGYRVDRSRHPRLRRDRPAAGGRALQGRQDHRAHVRDHRHPRAQEHQLDGPRLGLGHYLAHGSAAPGTVPQVLSPCPSATWSCCARPGVRRPQARGSPRLRRQLVHVHPHPGGMEELYMTNDFELLRSSSSVSTRKRGRHRDPSRKPVASNGSIMTRPTLWSMDYLATPRIPKLPEMQGADHGDLP